VRRCAKLREGDEISTQRRAAQGHRARRLRQRLPRWANGSRSLIRTVLNPLTANRECVSVCRCAFSGCVKRTVDRDTVPPVRFTHLRPDLTWNLPQQVDLIWWLLRWQGDRAAPWRRRAPLALAARKRETLDRNRDIERRRHASFATDVTDAEQCAPSRRPWPLRKLDI